jgi:stage II sporulation protein D
MFKKLVLLIAFALNLSATDLSEQNKPPTVRVLLTKLVEDALIEVRGRYLVYNPKNNELITASSKKKRARIFTREDGIYWDESFPDIYEIRIVPNEESANILINGIQYKGCIEVYSIGGTINIVNEVDTQNYLKSILGPKVDQNLPKEALDSIVITERTNLFYLIQKDPYASWQVEADAVGYTGLIAGRQNSNVVSAVNRTRDLIMHHKKKPFATSWGGNHTGRSVSFNSVFRKSCTVPKGVDNLPSLGKREKNRFRSTVPCKTLSNIVGLSSITEIDLFRAEKSKKVYAVRFISPEGLKDLGFFELQQELGESTLPSNDFTITLKGKIACIKGYGKGAGVGLCAFSAEILAQRKFSTRAILQAHFPGAEILNLHEKGENKPNTSFIWN